SRVTRPAPSRMSSSTHSARPGSLREDCEPDDLAVLVERRVVDGAECELLRAGDTCFQLVDAVAPLFHIAGHPDHRRDLAEEFLVELPDGGTTVQHPGAGAQEDRFSGEQRGQLGVGAAVDDPHVSVSEGAWSHCADPPPTAPSSTVPSSTAPSSPVPPSTAPPSSAIASPAISLATAATVASSQSHSEVLVRPTTT